MILPWEYLEPVLSWDDLDPDRDENDSRQESFLLSARNEAIELVLMGEAHPDSALELMLDQGQDVDAYIEEVVSNLEMFS